jgi:hypothetical protein
LKEQLSMASCEATAMCNTNNMSIQSNVSSVVPLFPSTYYVISSGTSRSAWTGSRTASLMTATPNHVTLALGFRRVRQCTLRATPTITTARNHRHLRPPTPNPLLIWATWSPPSLKFWGACCLFMSSLASGRGLLSGRGSPVEFLIRWWQQIFG